MDGFLLNTKFSANNSEWNSQPCNNKNNYVKVQKVANSSKGTRGRWDKYRRCIKLGFMSENSKTGIKEIIVKQELERTWGKNRATASYEVVDVTEGRGAHTERAAPITSYRL